MLLLVLAACNVAVAADEDVRESRLTPDIRGDDTNLKLQKGNFVIVPIPISNPTIGTGLIAGGAYFYGQTPEQKKVQPASVTAAAALYTDSDSRGYGIVQQNYWDRNRWRFTGAIGQADLRLSLRAAGEEGSPVDLSWGVDGTFAYTTISRKIFGKWYGGLLARYVDVTQTFGTPQSPPDLELAADIRSAGLGLTFEYDNRDMPINTYEGNRVKAELLFNEESLGSDNTYQSYTLSYSSYHRLAEPWVLAWQVSGCKKSGSIPVWDACFLNLRGFPVTNYIGDDSVSAQLEARWRASRRWGFVGFAGAGYMPRTLERSRERDPIPSYGIGVRFMVLPAKRINLRVDYARSSDDDAIHVAVGEAF